MFDYVIINDVNLKIYIGKTTQKNLQYYLANKFIRARLGIKVRSHLFAAIRKYGCEHFHIYPLFEGVTNEEISKHENLLVRATKAQHPDIGYNICEGGRGCPGAHPKKGIPRTREVIEKIKAARAIQDEAPRIEGCRKWVREHPEEASTRLSHEAHVLGGKAGSREAKQRAARISVRGGSIVKAQHTRWHVNRGRTNPECPLCRHSD